MYKKTIYNKMAIIIIFFALILVWKRERHPYEDNRQYNPMDALAPALAVGAMNNQGKQCCCQPCCCQPCCGGNETDHSWDIERDQMREFANTREAIAAVKETIKDTANAQQAINDRYHYENRAANDRGFYDNRVATDRGFYDTRAAIDRNDYNTMVGFKDSAILNLNNKHDIIKEINTLKDQIKEDALRTLGNKVTYLETILALQPKAPQPAYYPNYPMPVYEPVAACH